MVDKISFSTFVQNIQKTFSANNFTEAKIHEFFDTANNQDEDLTTLNETELKVAMQTVHTNYQVIKDKQKPSLELNDGKELSEAEIYDNIEKINQRLEEKRGIIFDFIDNDGTGALEGFASYNGGTRLSSNSRDLVNYVNELNEFCTNNPEIGDRVKSSGIQDLLNDMQSLVQKRDNFYAQLPEDY